MKKNIRTLGLYQPYAGLMLHGKYETRWIEVGKKPPFPLGPYVIYATKKEYGVDSVRNISGEIQLQRIRSIVVKAQPHNSVLTNYHGHALMLGYLVQVRDMKESDSDKAFVEYHPPKLRPVGKDGKLRLCRMVVLIYNNVKPIEPFPIKGKQGIGFLHWTEEEKIKYI